MKVKKLFFLSSVVPLLLLCLLMFNVTAFAADLPSVTANYQISAGKTTAAGISVANNDTKPHEFSLKVIQLPKDFKGYFMLDNKAIENLSVPAAQKSIIQFYIDTPINPSVTEVTVPLQLLRDDGVEQILYLSYSLNKDYTLAITNNVESLKVVSGNTARIEIGVTNTGTKELMGINLQVDLPYKWILEKADPKSLSLSPNESSIYTLNVVIPSSQQAGDFQIKITCANKDATSNMLSIPVIVSTNVNYLWWIVGGIVLLSIFTVLFFRKHGRR